MKYLLLLLVFAAVEVTPAQEPDWLIKLKKIQTGVSTKLDVERIFDSPRSAGGSSEKRGEESAYPLADGYLIVIIAAGTCPPNLRENCSVSKGTVIEAIFSPSIRPKETSFDFKTSQFQGFYERDNPTLHYIDKRAGLDYVVVHGEIRNVRIFHPAVYKRILRNIQAGG